MKALIIVDYQFDFSDPKGKLYVNNAESLKPYIENLIKEFKKEGNVVVATKDSHPIDHYSFEQWGEHCILDSIGSELYFDAYEVDLIIKKGIHKDAESYSAFFDEKGNSNGLDEYLKSKDIKDITIVGVASDVCVQATVIDGIKLNYKITIDFDGTKGIAGNKITI